MSTFTSFAIVGAGGGVGKIILDSLVATKKARILVITRPGSSSVDLENLPTGVKTLSVFYHDKETIARELKKHGVEVFISAIAMEGLIYQGPLGDAGKKAGVQLFVPSDYGVPTTGFGPGDFYLGEKESFAKYLQSISLPSARFHVGQFHSALPMITAAHVDRKMHLLHEGNTKATFTEVEDIGGFIARILTTLPKPQLQGKEFRIQGDRFTLREAAERLGWGVERVDSVPGDSTGFIAFLQELHERGMMTTGWNQVAHKEELEGEKAAGSSNKLWEGHIWKKIEDSVKS